MQLSTQLCHSSASDSYSQPPFHGRDDYDGHTTSPGMITYAPLHIIQCLENLSLNRNNLHLLVPHSDALRYGCLYDLSIEILPTDNSEVIEVIDDKACTRYGPLATKTSSPTLIRFQMSHCRLSSLTLRFQTRTTLHLGSRLLLLVHVRLLPTAPRCNSRSSRHRRQSSDDLIEDLEYHLGSTKLDYLQVLIRYQHSGFSQRAWLPRTTTIDGIMSLKTMVETTAIAAIKLQGSSSLWSPRDALQPNPLFEIIASHWGAETTSDVIRRILSSRSLPSQRRETIHQQSSLPARLYDNSGSTGSHSISSGGEPTPIPRAQKPSRIPRQNQSALTARTAIKPPARLTRTRTMVPKSDNTVKPPAPPTRAAPPIPRRQTSLNKGHTRSPSSAERPHDSQKHQLSRAYDKALPFLSGDGSDSSDDESVRRAIAHAAGYPGRGPDIHAHRSMSRNIWTSDAAVVGQPPNMALTSSSGAYGVEGYQPQLEEQGQHVKLSSVEESVTPTGKRSPPSGQASSEQSSLTRTPRTGDSTGSVIKNESSDIKTIDPSDHSRHLESSPSSQQRTNSFRTRKRLSEQSHASSLGSPSVTTTSTNSRQNRAKPIIRPPPPPPPSYRPPIPAAAPSSRRPSSSESMSRTSSMTTRKASPTDFDAMEFGLMDTARRGDGNQRSGRGTGYDGGHSDGDPRDNEPNSVDMGFTTQTMPSRHSRQSGPHNGPGGFLGIDRVRQVAGSVNGPNRYQGRVAAAAARYENGGNSGGSLKNRIGGGNGAGSWRQRGDQGRSSRGTDRRERSGESKDKEKQAGRWGWPNWW